MIPLNESSKLEFSLSIQNSTSKLDKATLFIEGGKYDIALPIVIEDDKAKVDIPILDKILEAGTYNMRLEMVLSGVLYTPFRDTLQFSAPPSIRVESTVKPSILVSPRVLVGAITPVLDTVVPTVSKPPRTIEDFTKSLTSAFA